MTDCLFEQDMLDALTSHRWPARAGDSLREHVAACLSCRDLATVAGALMHEGEAAYAAAEVPTSGLVWHRAQLRAREEAARAAMRPIGFVQGVAFTAGVAAVIAIAVWGLPALASTLPDPASLTAALPAMPRPSFDVQALALLSNTTVQFALAAWVVVAPAALYFTLRDSSS